LIPWLYKWLPIIFGCHCRDDRSFHYRGRKFPVCARCTGELVGILVGIAGSFFWLPSVPAAIAMLLPLVADGFLQLKTRYESTNLRRVATGFLFGYGLLALFLISSKAAFLFGYHLTNGTILLFP
jgi:uncharacterized membrane protein